MHHRYSQVVKVCTYLDAITALSNRISADVKIVVNTTIVNLGTSLFYQYKLTGYQQRIDSNSGVMQHFVPPVAVLF